CLPTGSDEAGVPEKVGVANLIGIAKGVFGTRMGLIDDALFASNHFEDVIRRPNMIDRSVLGMRPLKGAFGGFAHEPVDRLGNVRDQWPPNITSASSEGINRNFESDCLRHIR